MIFICQSLNIIIGADPPLFSFPKILEKGGDYQK